MHVGGPYHYCRLAMDQGQSDIREFLPDLSRCVLFCRWRSPKKKCLDWGSPVETFIDLYIELFYLPGNLSAGLAAARRET